MSESKDNSPIWDTLEQELAEEESTVGKPRQANAPAEVWAQWGLTVLCGSAQDGVESRDIWGIIRLVQSCSGLGLTDRQWEIAIRLCRKYKQLLTQPEPA